MPCETFELGLTAELPGLPTAMHLPAGAVHPAKPTASMDTDMTFDPAVEEVKKYCLRRPTVDLKTTALHFTDVAAADLARWLKLPGPETSLSCFCVCLP